MPVIKHFFRRGIDWVKWKTSNAATAKAVRPVEEFFLTSHGTFVQCQWTELLTELDASSGNPKALRSYLGRGPD
jgi:hypothetical protein